MYIIGIEGLVRAGKTTLSNFLAKKFEAKLIHEYGVYSSGSQSFPDYPPKSYQNALDSIPYFMGLESQRISDIDPEDKIVIVDRTYLTCIAFDYSAREFTGFDIYEEAQKSWSSAKKIEPDLIFFLDVSNEELNIRIAPNRHKYLPHFYEPSFNALMREFYLIQCQKDQRIIQIDANQDINTVQKTVLRAVQERTAGGK